MLDMECLYENQLIKLIVIVVIHVYLDCLLTIFLIHTGLRCCILHTIFNRYVGYTALYLSYVHCMLAQNHDCWHFVFQTRLSQVKFQLDTN